jgi:hypothetical protein
MTGILAREDEVALKDLLRVAVALNLRGKSKPKPRRASSKRADYLRRESDTPSALDEFDFRAGGNFEIREMGP